MQLNRAQAFLAVTVVMLVGCTTQINSGAKTQSLRNDIDSLLKRLIPVDTNEGGMTGKAVPSIETQQNVHDSLLSIAGQTPEARAEVIEALLQVMEDPQARGESSIDYRWTVAVDVLGELKATEAIDLLIKNLDQTGQNDVCISLSYHPVARALARIGEPAIPQLMEVWANSSNDEIRHQAEVALVNIGEPAKAKMQEALYQGDVRARGRAAWVLAWIGGKDAGTVIKDAIVRESDPGVLKELKGALREVYSRWG
jgi:PBS lyase HEAT-like repeat